MCNSTYLFMCLIYKCEVVCNNDLSVMTLCSIRYQISFVLHLFSHVALPEKPAAKEDSSLVHRLSLQILLHCLHELQTTQVADQSNNLGI